MAVSPPSEFLFCWRMLYTFNVINFLKNVKCNSLTRNLQPATRNPQPKKGFTPLNPAKREFRQKRNYLTGFTVIELLVVVAIIGIVSGIIVASVSGSKAKGRDAKRIADISVIQLALERYYDEKRYYPTDLSSSSNSDDLSDYDSSVPTKDSSGNDYKYSALNADNTATCSNDCQSYHLGATLELANGILDDDTVDEDNNIGFIGTGLVYDVLPKF